MEKEIWKTIKEYPDYEVSNLGYVHRKGRASPLKAGSHSMGYLQVGLSHNGKHTTRSVHRLVAQAFIPNTKNKPQTNHIDGNKQNNIVSNLEWCTPKENASHAYETGLIKDFSFKIKPVVAYMGEVMHIFESLNQAERETGTLTGDISLCCSNKKGRKTANGFYWRYI